MFWSKGLTSPEYLKPIEEGKGWMAVLRKLFAAQPRDCAVCVPDGAQLMLHGISPSLQHFQGLAATEPVKFRQLSANAQTYRDAVEFKNGLKLRVQELEEGQSVEVLALSSEKTDVQEEVHSRQASAVAATAMMGGQQ